MAMGIAKIFNISLPLNFNSPYKANNIIDFWRRWHITLTKFLTEFIFISLNLKLSRKLLVFNKVLGKGNVALYFSLIATFLISGIWHGAGWNFLFWGLIHGLFLVFNYFWINCKKKLGLSILDRNILYIGGQETGTKTQMLEAVAEDKYDQDKILIIGDALGDLQAAQNMGTIPCTTIPIPYHEKRSRPRPAAPCGRAPETA